MKFLQNIVRALAGVAIAATPAGALTSCDSAIYDDLDPCDEGVVLRFVYDYNMEYANAFPAKVDCLTLHIYDSEGRFVETRTELSRAMLSDESYRMRLDLPAGTYRMVAYGGMECDAASFAYTNAAPAAAATLTDLSVTLPLADDATSSTLLHPLYYGAIDVTVEPDKMGETTLPMMKDTNNLRIVLQHLSGSPVDGRDFDFLITDDNTVLAHDNSVVKGNPVTYTPWTSGTASAGTDDSGADVTVGYAELSTSRFVTSNSPRLIIRNRATGANVVDIPLVNYLLLLKSDIYTEMGSQEFLDRQSEWSMVFFLTGDAQWYNVMIKINDWVVRLNDTEL
ncbi:MAG: FimB/Mfa2 family fimbrial subunit [Paramuribaculum sp.]|nr:FimB/Mfa2 family fimbrial subunit [Paramuribaculum sp.]